jgi:hypothetical protein
MGAQMMCSFGVAPSAPVVLPAKKTFTDEVPDANIMDHGSDRIALGNLVFAQGKTQVTSMPGVCHGFGTVSSLVSTSRSKPTALRAVSFQQVLPLLPRPSPHRTIAMSHAPMLAAVLADGGLYVRA